MVIPGPIAVMIIKMIPKEALIEIGTNQKINSEQKVVLSKLDDINRKSHKFWHSSIIDLDDETLVKLYKGIVIVEKELNWAGGSVAGGVWVYKEIVNRKLDNNYFIADWTLSITNNNYLPFGSTNYGAKGIVEYFQSKWHIFQRNETEKISKEMNVLNNEINGLKNTIHGQQKEIDELKYRNSLLLKSNNEIAKIIISDKSKPVYFYMPEIERILNDKTIEKEIFEQLLIKFKEKEKRNIRALKLKIEQRINNYN